MDTKTELSWGFRAFRWWSGLLVWLYFSLRGYQAKSWLYRYVFEWKYLKLPICTVPSIDLIPAIIDYGKQWRSDSWLQGFDAVSSPQYAQEVFLNRAPVPEHGLDCDEHAIFITALIENSLREGTCDDGYYSPKFFTVIWIDPETLSISGHNVCLLTVPQGPGKFDLYSYMDYGLPNTPVNSIHEVALQVIEERAKGSLPLVWMVQNTALTPEIVQRGAP